MGGETENRIRPVRPPSAALKSKRAQAGVSLCRNRRSASRKNIFPHRQQKALMLPEKPGSSRLPALWCRWRDLNPHASSATDFESASSANSNTPARQGLLYTTRAAKSSAEKAAAGNSRGGPDFHRSISPQWRYISFPPPEAPAASSAPRWSERRFQSAP